MKVCPECGTAFTPRRSDQGFCGATCNSAFEARALKRSRALYKALYHWRASRKDAKEDLRFICRSISAWVEEDRAAGRGKPPRHDHGRDRGFERTRRPATGEDALKRPAMGTLK